jgi:hypothetical protein
MNRASVMIPPIRKHSQLEKYSDSIEGILLLHYAPKIEVLDSPKPSLCIGCWYIDMLDLVVRIVILASNEYIMKI